MGKGGPIFLGAIPWNSVPPPSLSPSLPPISQIFICSAFVSVAIFVFLPLKMIPNMSGVEWGVKGTGVLVVSGLVVIKR